MLARDGVGGDELLHALVKDLGIRGVGLGSSIIGLGLIDFLTAGTVLSGVKGGFLGACSGFGLRNFFRPVATQHLVEVGLGLLDGRLSLRALGFEFIALEADENGASFDDLSFFNGNFGDAAADLRADLDFAGFDGAGVFVAAAVGEVG